MQNRVTGLFNPLVALLFWPFHICLHLRLDVRRRLFREPLYNQVVEGWYIGSWPHTPKALPKEENGLAVLDCTVEFERRHEEPYFCVPTWDTQGVKEDYIGEAVDWALAQRAQGRAVLVHCAHGHGRSLGVLCACLIMSGECTTYEEAVRAAQAVRPRCKLNHAQVRSLEAYLRRMKKLT